MDGPHAKDAHGPSVMQILRLHGVELTVDSSELGGGLLVRTTLRRPSGNGSAPVAIDRVRFLLDARPGLVLEHGWQSWSPVGVRAANKPARRRRLAPEWVRSTYHAEGRLASSVVGADQFMLMAGGLGCDPGGIAGFLDGRRHLSSMIATPQGVVVMAHLDALALEPGEERELDPLWIAEGDSGSLYSQYVEHWAKEARARNQASSMLGWCSWYHYFMKVTPADVRENLAIGRNHGVEVVQMDDGYPREIGDWLESRPPFDGGEMPALAAEIQAAGCTPGIWSAPFLAGARSRLAHEHPDWLVRDPHRQPLTAIWNPITWRGRSFALDTTNPEVLEHLRQVFSKLRSEGWSYHKVDFCYAAAMPGRRMASGRMTRAEALRLGLEAIRDGVGDDAFLLGCGCPFAQAVGVVDAMRVSADTAPKWSPGIMQVPGYPEPSPALKNAVKGSVLRAPMHRRLWLNDPDCLMLRPTRTRLRSSERAIGAAVVGGNGGFVVLSDDLALYGEEQWRLLERLRSAKESTDAPLDLVDPFGRELKVRSAAGSRLEVRLGGRSTAPPGEEGETRAVLAEGGSRTSGPWARLSIER